jgi:hypothetical protein
VWVGVGCDMPFCECCDVKMCGEAACGNVSAVRYADR